MRLPSCSPAELATLAAAVAGERYEVTAELARLQARDDHGVFTPLGYLVKLEARQTERSATGRAWWGRVRWAVYLEPRHAQLLAATVLELGRGGPGATGFADRVTYAADRAERKSRDELRRVPRLAQKAAGDGLSETE